MCLRPDTVCLCRFSMASDLSFDRFNLTCYDERDRLIILSLTFGNIANTPESSAAGISSSLHSFSERTTGAKLRATFHCPFSNPHTGLSAPPGLDNTWLGSCCPRRILDRDREQKIGAFPGNRRSFLRYIIAN